MYNNYNSNRRYNYNNTSVNNDNMIVTGKQTLISVTDKTFSAIFKIVWNYVWKVNALVMLVVFVVSASSMHHAQYSDIMSLLISTFTFCMFLTAVVETLAVSLYLYFIIFLWGRTDIRKAYVDQYVIMLKLGLLGYFTLCKLAIIEPWGLLRLATPYYLQVVNVVFGSVEGLLSAIFW